ncbi:hypothetical protein ACFL35_01735 [Candidatus Riflebacteria bacterium]
MTEKTGLQKISEFSGNNKCLCLGSIILILGWTPLFLAIIISIIMGDPNPNPIGPGLIAFLATPVGLFFIFVAFGQYLYTYFKKN